MKRVGRLSQHQFKLGLWDAERNKASSVLVGIAYDVSGCFDGSRCTPTNIVQLEYEKKVLSKQIIPHILLSRKDTLMLPWELK